MKPASSMYQNEQDHKEALEAYQNGCDAFAAGKEHHLDNFPEKFYSEWSDGWIDSRMGISC